MNSRSLADFFEEFSYDQVLSYQLREGVGLYGARLVTGSGEPSELAEYVASFEHSSTFGLLLHKTLKSAALADGVFSCLPVYRDVLVFGDHMKETVGILHISFTCHHLLDHLGNAVSCDEIGFERLATLMRELGHRIRTDYPY